MRTIILTLSATLFGCTGDPCVLDAPRVVSVSSDGAPSNEGVRGLAVSADGCRVVFESWSTNLVSGAVQEHANVYLHDVRTGTTELVGARPTDDGTSAETVRPRISADGRHVVFESGAPNLVEGDTNRGIDAFVLDVDSGETRRISVDGKGGEIQSFAAGTYPDISADGAWVSFYTNAMLPTTGRRGTHIRRIDGSGLMAVWPEDPGYVDTVRLSGDGRIVVYNQTHSTDLPSRPHVLDTTTGEHRAVLSDDLWPGKGLAIADIDDAGARLLIGLPADPSVPESHGLAVVDIATGEVVWEGGSRLHGFHASGLGSGYSASLSGDGTTIAFGAKSFGVSGDADDDYADVYVVDIASGLVQRIGDPAGDLPRDGDTVGGDLASHVVLVKSTSSHLLGPQPPNELGWRPAQAVLLPRP